MADNFKEKILNAENELKELKNLLAELESYKITLRLNGNINGLNTIKSQIKEVTDMIKDSENEIKQLQRAQANVMKTSSNTGLAGNNLFSQREKELNQLIKDYDLYIKKTEALRDTKISGTDRLKIFNDRIKSFNFRDNNGEYLKGYEKLQDTILLKQTELKSRIAREQEAETKKLQDELNKRFSAELNYFEKKTRVYGKKFTGSEKLAYFNNMKSNPDYSSASMQESIQEQITKAQKQAEEETKNSLSEIFSNISSTVGKIHVVIGTIGSAVRAVINVIRSGFSIMNSSIKVTLSIVNVFKNALTRIISLFGNLGNRVGLLSSQGNILSGTWTELSSKLNVIFGLVDKLLNNKFISNGLGLLSAINTMNIVIGKDLTANTLEWADSLEKAFGISASSMLSNLKGIVAVMDGLGMKTEDVARSSKNLASVGMVLSSVTGYDTETVLSKIESGMKGMVTAIDDLGLSVRETQMNAFLKDLKAQGGEYANIATSMTNLTEQQRVYVRYAAIMQQFTDAGYIEKYVKALDSVTGRVNNLKNSMSTLTSTIGTLFLSLFDNVIMPITYIINTITAKIKSFAKNVLDIDLDINMDMNKNKDLTDSFSGIADEADNVAESVNNAKGSLDAWDHVTSMSSSSSSSGTSNFDYSKLMDSFGIDAADTLEKLAQAQDAYMTKCEEAFKALPKKIKDGLSKAWENLKDNYIDPKGIEIFGENNWNKIKTSFENLRKRLASVIGAIKVILGQFFGAFNSNDSTSLITGVIDTICGLLDKLIKKLGELEVNNAGQKLYNTLKKIGIVIKTLFTGKTSTKDLDFLNGGETESTFIKINNLATTLHDIFISIKDIVIDTGKQLAEWAKTEGMDKLTNTINKVSEFLKNNKDSIASFLAGIAKIQFNYVTDLVDNLVDIGQWVADNKDTILYVLNLIEKLLTSITGWIGTCLNRLNSDSGIWKILSMLSGHTEVTSRNVNDAGASLIWNLTPLGPAYHNIKRVLGFANGGAPKAGSLFYANESGNSELVGNFGGYTGVANQGMIIDAIKQAVGSSMYSAMTEALKNVPISGNTNIEVCKGGLFVGDNSSMRKLASILNNTNTSTRSNIANTGFRMN
nr:MAG TPA: hypothetical protein [Caudoviricetes sp.]